MVAIVSRAEWGAQPPKSRQAIATPTAELWFHHFATDGWHGAVGMRTCQRFHQRTNGWADIGYSYCVDDDGTIYEGRGAGVRGAHTEGHNTIGHAICLMSNADVTKPTKAMIRSAAQLAAHGRNAGWWGDWTGGHRQASGASTACPGRYGMAALPDLRALTVSYLTNPQEERPFMALSDAQQKKLADDVAFLRIRMDAGPSDGGLVRPTWEWVSWLRKAGVPRLIAQVSALQEVVNQLGAGGDVDYARVQQAVEDGIKATLGSLDE